MQLARPMHVRIQIDPDPNQELSNNQNKQLTQDVTYYYPLSN